VVACVISFTANKSAHTNTCTNSKHIQTLKTDAYSHFNPTMSHLEVLLRMGFVCLWAELGGGEIKSETGDLPII